jgi:hypothetical protein
LLQLVSVIGRFRQELHLRVYWLLVAAVQAVEVGQLIILETVGVAEKF